MPLKYSFLFPICCLILLKKFTSLFLHYTFEWNQDNFAYQTSSLQPIILHNLPHCLTDSTISTTVTPIPNCFEQDVFDFLFFSFTFLPFWKLIASCLFLMPQSSSPSHECLPTSKFVAHSAVWYIRIFCILSSLPSCTCVLLLSSTVYYFLTFIDVPYKCFQSICNFTRF